MPEQISSEPCSAPGAVLLDPFGGAHGIGGGLVIGRRRDFSALVLAYEGISRHHASVSRNAAGAWTVEDLGSTNGMFVNGRRVSRATLAFGDTIRVAEVSLYFEHVGQVDANAIATSTQTVPSPPLRVDDADTEVRDAAPRAPSRYAVGSQTWLLSEPGGGGGGVVKVGDAAVSLTLPQLELVRLLLDRARVDAALPDEVRGFVSTGELVADIPWDTPHPNDDNVKHLVRRVRRVLAREGLDDTIESRPGFGYRLRVLATTEPS